MAVNDGFTACNPAELLHTPNGTRKERRVLTIDQARWMLSTLGLRERLIVKLAAISGMRPGEIVGPQWADLTPEGLPIARAPYRGVI